MCPLWLEQLVFKMVQWYSRMLNWRVYCLSVSSRTTQFMTNLWVLNLNGKKCLIWWCFPEAYIGFNKTAKYILLKFPTAVFSGDGVSVQGIRSYCERTKEKKKGRIGMEVFWFNRMVQGYLCFLHSGSWRRHIGWSGWAGSASGLRAWAASYFRTSLYNQTLGLEMNLLLN